MISIPTGGLADSSNFPAQQDDPIPEESEADFDRIAYALENTGYLILPSALPGDLTEALCRRINSLAAEELSRAGVGRGQDHRLLEAIRSDAIRWLSASHPVESAYLAWMERLRLGLNRRLFLGLFDYECHFAVYEAGAYYRKHLDAFQGGKNRVLTTVFYLNPQWSEDDGGELLIYPDQGDEPLERVMPEFGKLVIFLSDRFPHEVSVSRRKRFSLAGWFHINASR
ncbi:MAG: 2OG-Fe(II) oxygenase [Methylococcaceae bacterium]|nr:2OG-Fe(II) oxygenase [Methylococcaceae bacterium]